MKQKLKFCDIYKNCKNSLQSTARALWCSSAHTEHQKLYVQQFEKVISELFMPSKAMPIVECMDPYENIDVCGKASFSLTSISIRAGKFYVKDM